MQATNTACLNNYSNKHLNVSLLLIQIHPIYPSLHSQIKHHIYLVMSLSETCYTSPEATQLHPTGFNGPPLPCLSLLHNPVPQCQYPQVPFGLLCSQAPNNHKSFRFYTIYSSHSLPHPSSVTSFSSAFKIQFGVLSLILMKVA